LKLKTSWVILISTIFVTGLVTGLNAASTFGGDRTHKDVRVSSNVYFARDGVTFQSSNLITNIGAVYLRNILAWNNVTVGTVSCLSLGNGTPAASMTKLTTEATLAGFDRKNGTVSNWLNGTKQAYNVTYTWAATDAVTVQSCGLHWGVTDDSDNNMFAVAYLTDGTQQQFTIGSNCTLTWVNTLDV